MNKFLNTQGVIVLWEKVKAIMDSKVDKELKTGSTTEYKVLSDNNLTDALVTKIRNAGSGTFTGSYEDLTELPESFPPSEHSHTVTDITDLESRLTEITGNPAAELNTIEKLANAIGNDTAFYEKVDAKAEQTEVEQVKTDLQTTAATADSALSLAEQAHTKANANALTLSNLKPIALEIEIISTDSLSSFSFNAYRYGSIVVISYFMVLNQDISSGYEFFTICENGVAIRPKSQFTMIPVAIMTNGKFITVGSAAAGTRIQQTLVCVV